MYYFLICLYSFGAPTSVRYARFGSGVLVRTKFRTLRCFNGCWDTIIVTFRALAISKVYILMLIFIREIQCVTPTRVQTIWELHIMTLNHCHRTQLFLRWRWWFTKMIVWFLSPCSPLIYIMEKNSSESLHSSFASLSSISQAHISALQLRQSIRFSTYHIT